MSLLRVDVNARELLKAPREISRAWVRAANRATRKATRQTTTEGLRAIAQAEKVQIGRLRKYKRGSARIDKVQGVNVGTSWFGIVQARASVFGKARKARGGARAGSRFFPDAFVSTVLSTKGGEHTSAWKRVGRSRLPIYEDFTELASSETALSHVERGVPTRIEKLMAQELRFEGLKLEGAA